MSHHARLLIIAAVLSQLLSEPRPPFLIGAPSASDVDRSAGVSLTFTVTGAFSGQGPIEVLLLESAGSGAPRWRFRSRHVVPVADDSLTLRAQPDTWALLVFRQPGEPGYGLHGPFRWPSAAGSISLALTRLRTIRAGMPRGVEWLRADWLAAGTLVPAACEQIARAIECIGVPWDERGILIARDNAESLWHSASVRPQSPSTVEEIALRRTAWAASFEIQPLASGIAPPTLRASVWRSRRSASAAAWSRVYLVPLAGYEATWVTTSMLWLAGPAPGEDAVLTLEGPKLATTRIGLHGAGIASPEQPVGILMQPSADVLGTVLSPEGRPVANAVVAVSEFLDAAGNVLDTSARAAFRRRAVEVISDEQGAFVATGLDEREYEWLVMHPNIGRALVIRRPDATMILSLEPDRIIAGRAVRRGAPVPGVPVMVVPLHADVTASADPIQHVGIETHADGAGRFRAAIPAGSRGEIRVGSAATGIARQGFGAPGRSSVIDVGDIELPGVLHLIVRLDGREGCDLSAAGPLGRVGLQIVPAVPDASGGRRLLLPEAGRWTLAVTCAGVEFAANPGVVTLEAGQSERTVAVTVVER